MKRETFTATLSLFTSTSTLICCALPALFVTLGAGAALAGMVSTFPFLVTLTEHKVLVFSIAGVLLTVSALLQYRARHAPCPIDPVLAKQCDRLRRMSIYITVFSAAVYLIGFFFAFIAVRLF